ncbi:hypothetical protein BO86DRAFT_393978 [Aspergillus japonicus CBS 114.51]|uniref:Zn(2)-C6 fungal-type domain-containing protein n=1 Tax=Aspergillus japonicus CBS 114.51 TaxID=1448312 RepID=A0A8T8WJX6_ASPJA|nr:hypothetical protein BO86DRAFT_393978 [Aspergillus japonicus CBS 114.51]RAH75779.1 hypothetical protein BO86DRAFT_393978 [Aspergillus japonicus CBS 114.51]
MPWTRHPTTQRSYSGCWTCRKRHVRCDERQPDCARCERAGFSCEGYATALNWVGQGDGSGPNRVGAPSGRRMRRRCAPASGHRSWPTLNSSQTQEELEDRVTRHGEAQQGPFSVFAVVRVAEGGRRSSWGAVGHFLDCNEPPPQRRLLDHWRLRLSAALMPIPAGNNILVSVFLPLALQGSVQPHVVATGRRALFHAICGLSASNLASLHSNDPELLELAVAHRRQSFNQLRLQLSALEAGGGEDSEVVALLATIILHLTESATEGIAHVWRQHIRGGLGLLQAVRSDLWSVSTSAAMVREMFQFLHTVATYQQCHCHPPIGSPTSGWYSSGSADNPRDLAYIQPALGGFPYTLLTALHRIQALPPAADLSPTHLDCMERELCHLAPPAGSRTHQPEIIHCHILHCSLLIFFQRRTGRGALGGLEKLAHAGWEHVRRLDAFETRGSPVTWPIIVIACEIQLQELRDQVLRWLALRARSGFAVYRRARDLLLRIWSGANPTFADHRWATLLHTVPEFDIYWG